ncbi:MAG: hypothetical protein LBW85_01310 [Deltaproteobacteria bacterium]|jgi:hypothetical protein|nr:hypothetical protein [Deltaproteobacteria bacterium]
MRDDGSGIREPVLCFRGDGYKDKFKAMRVARDNIDELDSFLCPNPVEESKRGLGVVISGYDMDRNVPWRQLVLYGKWIIVNLQDNSLEYLEHEYFLTDYQESTDKT